MNKYIETVIQDNPKLHWASPEHACKVTKLLWDCKPGLRSLAVPPAVLRYFESIVKPDWATIETGSGQSTIALAALAKHHTAIMGENPETHELIRNYMQKIGIPLSKLELVQKWSDVALPLLHDEDRFDFAFVDGCHGYPFPALDWHYLDKHLRIGGLIGFDNTEIRAVSEHCTFLEENGDYELIEHLNPHGNYGVSIFVKKRDEAREWTFQAYNRMPYLEEQAKLRADKSRISGILMPMRKIGSKLRDAFRMPDGSARL